MTFISVCRRQKLQRTSCTMLSSYMASAASCCGASRRRRTQALPLALRLLRCQARLAHSQQSQLTLAWTPASWAARWGNKVVQGVQADPLEVVCNPHLASRQVRTRVRWDTLA